MPILPLTGRRASWNRLQWVKQIVSGNHQDQQDGWNVPAMVIKLVEDLTG